MLLLGLAGLAALANVGWRERERWALSIPLTIVALLTFCCVFVRINIGVRHVLIAYPFLAIGMAHALTLLWRNAAHRTAWRGVATVALAWHLSPAALAHPDYLPWFNEAVREPRKVLVDSDLDWGQDLQRLSRRLRDLGMPSVHIAYAGTADLSREGLPPFRDLPPNERATGWIAVSELARLASRWGGAPDGYAWLDTYGARERIGRTVELYYVPPGSDPPGAPNP
jgi:hypothetical protein